MVNIATISISKRNSIRVGWKAKGNLEVVVHNVGISILTLKETIDDFFKQAKDQGLELGNNNVVFTFDFEKE